MLKRLFLLTVLSLAPGLVQADDAKTCDTWSDVLAGNKDYNPSYVKLTDDQIPLIAKAYTDRGTKWPDNIVTIWIGRTPMINDTAFIYAIDSEGCLALGGHVSVVGLAAVLAGSGGI
jgi:hypothetical protein